MNSPEPTTDPLLRCVATHLSTHPGFVASRLVQLSPAAPATREFTDEQLTRLALRRAPRPDSVLTDVRRIATYIGVSVDGGRSRAVVRWPAGTGESASDEASSAGV